MGIKSIYNKGQVLLEKTVKKRKPCTLRKGLPLCNAMFCNVFLSIKGVATPCCMNQKYVLGDYRSQPLGEIWEGEAAMEFRRQIQNNQFPVGCEGCRDSLGSGIISMVQINQYEKFCKSNFIQRIEFQTGNTCNLACDMCSGMLSSSVAIKKEGYINNTEHKISLEDPSFIKILKNINEAHFSGGEPFLVNSYKDIWQFLAKNNPNCKIIVQTNGTILNKEIESIMESGNFHVNISIDSITPGKYEEIRVNASLDKVLQNLNYFRNIRGDGN